MPRAVVGLAILALGVAVPSAPVRAGVGMPSSSLVEPRSVGLALVSAPGATLGESKEAQATSLAGDTPSLSFVGPAVVEVKEGAAGTKKKIVFGVKLKQPGSGEQPGAARKNKRTVTVQFQTKAGAEGDPADDDDFTFSFGKLIFTRGATGTKYFSVWIKGDDEPEPDETVFAALYNPTKATISGPDHATITIVNDDEAKALPTVSLEATPQLGLKVKEGDPGSAAKKLAFKVKLSAPSEKDVTVLVSAVPGTATAGSDFNFGNYEALIPVGKTETGFLAVAIKADTVPEPDETLTVKLADPVNATIGTGALTFTILNDDEKALPTVEVGSPGDFKETNSGQLAVYFVLFLSAPSDENVVVAFKTVDGTATAGSDYVAKSGSVAIPAGDQGVKIGLYVNGDTTVEPNETFGLALVSAQGATLGESKEVQATILNDDAAGPLPSLSISCLGAKEGNAAGSSSIPCTVSLGKAASAEVKVDVSTVDGTAKAGSDFEALSGTLTFAAGETSKQVKVSIVSDTVVEGWETLTVKLSNAVNASIAKAESQATISNDD